MIKLFIFLKKKECVLTGLSHPATKTFQKTLYYKWPSSLCANQIGILKGHVN